MKLSKSEAQEKYDIILTSDYGYVDLNDCSYIEYNNNSLRIHLVFHISRTCAI